MNFRTCSLGVLILTVGLGCGRSDDRVSGEEQPAGPQPADANQSSISNEELLGQWVVVADASGRGDTGTLTLNADGTFAMVYEMPDSQPETAEGSFIFETEVVGETERVVVLLSIERFDGRDAPKAPPMRLLYDKSRNILHDVMTVAYSRPSEVESAKADLKR